MRDTSFPETVTTATVETRGLPDARCIAFGDRYLNWSIRSYAAGGLSDYQIGARILRLPDVRADEIAAAAVAHQCALMDLPARKIVAILAYLAAEVPCWPDDPDEIAAIVRAAVGEFA